MFSALAEAKSGAWHYHADHSFYWLQTVSGINNNAIENNLQRTKRSSRKRKQQAANDACTSSQHKPHRKQQAAQLAPKILRKELAKAYK